MAFDDDMCAMQIGVCRDFAEGMLRPHPNTESCMADTNVARVTEISARSNQSFEDAIRDGIKRATDTLRNVRSAWVKEQRITVNENGIDQFQVNMMVTFELDD